eukprot:scaffold3724_cov17-Tisochrysis_lutea.AAC.1
MPSEFDITGWQVEPQCISIIVLQMLSSSGAYFQVDTGEECRICRRSYLTIPQLLHVSFSMPEHAFFQMGDVEAGLQRVQEKQPPFFPILSLIESISGGGCRGRASGGAGDVGDAEAGLQEMQEKQGGGEAALQGLRGKVKGADTKLQLMVGMRPEKTAARWSLGGQLG